MKKCIALKGEWTRMEMIRHSVRNGKRGVCTVKDSVRVEKSLNRKALSSVKGLFEKVVGRRGECV